MKTCFVIVMAISPPTAARAVPPECRAEGGRLIVSGVSPECPMIYDNDWWQDVPDATYLWMKASRGKCDLRGNIITRCTFGWENGSAHKLQEQIDDCQKLLAIARESGLRNIAEPVLGAKEALRRPQSGKIEETRFASPDYSSALASAAHSA